MFKTRERIVWLSVSFFAMSAFIYGGAVSAEAIRSPQTIDIATTAIEVETAPTRVVHTGPSKAVIYDLITRTVSRMDLGGSDSLATPDFVHPPMNEVQFEFPVIPANLRFGLMDSNVGSCSVTYIGRRMFLTSGHCIYNGGWPLWVRVTPGFSSGQAPIGTFTARRLFTFNGFVDTGDAAHDVAVVEVDRELPPSIRPVPVRSRNVVCNPEGWGNIAFDRHFYQGGVGNQLTHAQMHKGCLQGMLWWFFKTLPGSSGSATLDSNQQAYAVLRGVTQDRKYGLDAVITRTKECFIREHLLQEFC